MQASDITVDSGPNVTIGDKVKYDGAVSTDVLQVPFESETEAISK